MVELRLPCPGIDHRELDWVETRMPPNFRTRLMLVVIAVLLSLVVALATAFVFYAAKESFLVPLTAGGGAFVATMTLALGVFSLFSQ
ncbi:hypothetical protein AB0N21_00010 [Streptomyces sp. NPDC051080]|uniref:hypothetical protein n=1 Tax=Streptomyces sp. NPDC051080 TaxID=3157222 RepID=UPI0034132121